MKKEYRNPKSKAICFDMECPILSESNLSIDRSGEEYDAEASYSNKKDNKSDIWDDEGSIWK